MTTLRTTTRINALLRLAAAVTLCAAAPLLGWSGTVAAQGGAPPAESVDDDTVPVSTLPAEDPFGLGPVGSIDPIDGGAPIGDPAVEIVQRWAITPQGANDPNAASTRAELSYTGDPGTKIEDGVTVFNLGNDVLTFRIYATDAINGPDGAFQLLAGDQQPTDVGTWVTISQENVTVAPGMAATIPITITVPPNAAPGDHTGGIVASSATLGTTDEGSILNVDRSVGTRLYLRVNGALRPELAIEDLGASYDGSINPLSGATGVTFRIQNRGNVRLGGTYEVEAVGPFGIGAQRVGPIEIPEILPGQGVQVTASLGGIPALGFVTATATVTPDGGDAVAAGQADATTRAIALPISGLLFLVALILGLVARRRMRRHGASVSTGGTVVAVVPERELEAVEC